MKLTLSLIYLAGTLAFLCAVVEVRGMIDANTTAVKSMTACQQVTMAQLVKVMK